MVGHVGQEFDAYRLLRRLGEGSYGVVYLGEHRSSGAQVAICEQTRGPTHPETATYLHHLARSAREKGQYTRAEALFQRALLIREQALGPEHTQTAKTCHQLGVLYWQQGRYTGAESLFLRALAIYEQALDQDSPRISELLEDYSVLLHEMHRQEEEARLRTRLAAMRAKRAATPESERSTESSS